MSRQLEALQEQRTAKRHEAVLRTLEFGLEGAVGHAGGVLTGFSVKMDEWECLVTLRAVLDGKPCIAFVGSDTLISCLLKAEREAQRDNLTWRADKFAAAEG